MEPCVIYGVLKKFETFSNPHALESEIISKANHQTHSAEWMPRKYGTDRRTHIVITTFSTVAQRFCRNHLKNVVLFI
jgi:hypothetical protein